MVWEIRRIKGLYNAMRRVCFYFFLWYIRLGVTLYTKEMNISRVTAEKTEGIIVRWQILVLADSAGKIAAFAEYVKCLYSVFPVYGSVFHCHSLLNRTQHWND